MINNYINEIVLYKIYVVALVIFLDEKNLQ